MGVESAKLHAAEYVFTRSDVLKRHALRRAAKRFVVDIPIGL
jgi:hypothetical protein